MSPEDRSLYQILMRFQILPPSQLNRLQQTYLQLLQQGRNLTLYQLLTKYLSSENLTRVTSLQKKDYLFCPDCILAYPLPIVGDSTVYQCPKCSSNLEVISNAQKISPSTPSQKLSQDSSIETGQPHPCSPDTKNSQISSSATLIDQLIPQPRSSYKFQKVLGIGGYGQVYEVLDPVLERTLALKILSIKKESSQKAQERFLREIKITAQLEHPNIIPVYDGGYLENNMPYYVMKKIHGGTLKEVLREKDPAEQEALRPKLLDIFLKICDAMEYAHSQEVIHRDLKPANIAVGKFGEVIVMDWGIAKCRDWEDLPPEESPQLTTLTTSQGDLTLKGDILGTPGYLPPEQAKGKISDQRSDIFSLGAILYQMLCFTLPFGGAPQNRIVATLMEDPLPPHLQTPNLNIPPELSAIALKALEKDKYKRYQDVGQFKEDIFRFRAGFGVSASKDSLVRTTLRALKRHRGKALAGCAVMIALILGLALSQWWNLRQTQKQIQQYTNQAKELLQSPAILREKKSISAKEKISIFREGQIEKALDIYSQARRELEKALELSSKDGTLRKGLYELEKNMGLLALKIRNYLLAKTCFEKYRKLYPNGKGDQLLRRVIREKGALLANRKKRVQNIMETLAQGPPQGGMMDEYITEVVKIASPEVVRVLLAHLEKPDEWQRKLAMEALGKIGDSSTKFKGKDSVWWLMKQLKMASDQKDKTEITYLIWALGRLRDGRANDLIYQCRERFKGDASLYTNTALPYSWIPISNSPANKSSYNWFDKGAMALMKSDFAKAITYYQKGISTDPKNPIKHLAFGNALFSMKKFKDSIHQYEKAISLKKDFIQAYVRRGNAYLALSEWQKGFDDHKKAMSLNPRSSAAYNGLGVYWFRKKAWKKALICFNTALSLPSPQARYFRNRAELYRILKSYKKALLDANQALSLNRKDGDTYHVLGMIYISQKRYGKAIDFLNRAIEFNPKNNNYYNSRGAYYVKTKKYARALEDFKKSLSLNPNNPQIYENMGVVYLQQKKYNLSESTYRKGLTLKPLRPSLYQQLGLLYVQTKKIPNALKAFQKYLSYNQKNSQAYNLVAVCYLWMNQPKDALPCLLKALKLSPKNPVLHNNIATVYLKLNNFEKASDHYSRAIQLNPNYAPSYNGMGLVLLQQKKYSPAIQRFDKAISLNRNLANPYYGRGMAWLKLNKKKLVIRDFRTFLQMAPKDSKAKQVKAILKQLTP